MTEELLKANDNTATGLVVRITDLRLKWFKKSDKRKADVSQLYNTAKINKQNTEITLPSLEGTD